MFNLDGRQDGDGYGRAAGLGAVAGLRSMLPFAMLAAALDRDGPVAGFAVGPNDGAARLLGSRKALIGFGPAAAGELVGDKLPATPSRLWAPVFAQRLVTGALVGGAVSSLDGSSPWAGAAIGAVSSGAAAAAGAVGRTTLPRVTPLPQQAWSLLEDGLVVVLGARVLGLRWR